MHNNYGLLLIFCPLKIANNEYMVILSCTYLEYREEKYKPDESCCFWVNVEAAFLGQAKLSYPLDFEPGISCLKK